MIPPGDATVLRHCGRVLLRRLCPDDLPAFQAYRQDPQVARFQGWSAMTDGEALAFLTDMSVAPLLRPGAWCQIGVALPDGGLVGDMGLHLNGDQDEVELGITLARAAQGRGLAHAAVTLALGFVFERSGAKRAVVWTNRRNDAAQVLIRRIGFVWRGEEAGVDKTGAPILEDRFEMMRPVRGAS